MMKETPDSLRAYFVVVALWNIYLGGRALPNVAGLSLLLAVMTLLFGVGFLLVGIQLKKALLSGVGWILYLIVGSVLLLVLDTTAVMIMVGGPMPFITGCIRFLI